jgi:cellobiose epimerase
MSEDTKALYLAEVERELKDNILPFWMNRVVDEEHGGFYGLITNDLYIDKKAPKGCILNSRILWTYSTAYRLFKDEKYLLVAKKACDFLNQAFWDKEYSGLYWMVDYQGNPVNTRKQIYNIAFGIYGLTEYHRATGDHDSLDKAIQLFRDVEKYSYDRDNRGYFEAFTREWAEINDMRLSPKDLNAEKSMNTHLHILEAYTNLYRVWKDKELEQKLEELIHVTTDHIIDNNTCQFKLFFDRTWQSLNHHISYGHDIEGSWLLYEAAEVLGNPDLLKKVHDIAVKMAQKVYEDGVDREYGGLLYEAEGQELIDPRKHWWPHAEAMVGFMNAYELSSGEHFYQISWDMWKFTDRYIVDHENGEWFSMLSRDLKVFEEIPKVEPWKCPYHNSRACFEMLERLKRHI